MCRHRLCECAVLVGPSGLHREVHRSTNHMEGTYPKGWKPPTFGSTKVTGRRHHDGGNGTGPSRQGQRLTPRSAKTHFIPCAHLRSAADACIAAVDSLLDRPPKTCCPTPWLVTHFPNPKQKICRYQGGLAVTEGKHAQAHDAVCAIEPQKTSPSFVGDPGISGPAKRARARNDPTPSAGLENDSPQLAHRKPNMKITPWLAGQWHRNAPV